MGIAVDNYSGQEWQTDIFSSGGSVLGYTGHEETTETARKRVKAQYSFCCINTSCGKKFSTQEKLYRCPSCRDLLDICYDFTGLDGVELKRRFHQRRSSLDPLDISGVWRYRELLPFDEEDYSYVVTLGEGNTPPDRGPESR